MSKFTRNLSIFYGVTFVHVGLILPFFSVWLKSLQFEPYEISIILAAPLFIRVIFTPLISFYSDRTGDHRRTIMILSWGTLFSLCLLFHVESFLQVLLVSALYSVFWTTIMPLTETIAMAGVRAWGLDYGRMRLWGSLTFIAASSLGGLILANHHPGFALYLFVVAALLIVGAAFLLPRNNNDNSANSGTMNVGDIFQIFKSPVFLLFLIGASTIQASHSVYYSFGSIHWQKQGHSEAIIGILWSVGVVAETVLFAYSSKVVAKVGAVWLLFLGAAGGVIRWSIMAFDPSLALLFPLQVLHALTFGAGHLGAVMFISQVIPEQYSATAQGLYAAFSMGFIMGLAVLISGVLYSSFAGAAYIAMAGLSGIAVLALILLVKIWNGGYISVTEN